MHVWKPHRVEKITYIQLESNTMTHLDRNRANKILQESVARVSVCAITDKYISVSLVQINFVREYKTKKKKGLRYETFFFHYMFRF